MYAIPKKTGDGETQKPETPLLKEQGQNALPPRRNALPPNAAIHSLPEEVMFSQMYRGTSLTRKRNT